MPNRTLREGLLRSEAWNSVDIVAQLLFIRLVLIADDFGCFDGREDVIMGRAYLRRFEPAEEFPGFLAELQRAGLIIRYSNRQRPFIAIPQWSWDYRYKRLFPAPPINVDVRDIGYRSKYGKKIDWRNPEGFDDVSVLLGLDGRAVAPQPDEWRRLSDYAPVTWSPPVTAVTTPVTAATEVVTTPSVTEQPSQSLVCSLRDSETLKLEDSQTLTTQTTSKPLAPVTAPQSLPPPPTTPTTTTNNGQIKLNGKGGWEGVSGAQQLRWQAMFDSISIGDQLARAAEWLIAHPEERAVIERDCGEEKFIVRWLLREVRTGHGPYKGDH